MERTGAVDCFSARSESPPAPGSAPSGTERSDAQEPINNTQPHPTARPAARACLPGDRPSVVARFVARSIDLLTITGKTSASVSETLDTAGLHQLQDQDRRKSLFRSALSPPRGFRRRGYSILPHWMPASHIRYPNTFTRRSRTVNNSSPANPRILRAPAFRFSPNHPRFFRNTSSTNPRLPNTAPSQKYRTRHRT